MSEKDDEVKVTRGDRIMFFVLAGAVPALAGGDWLVFWLLDHPALGLVAIALTGMACGVILRSLVSGLGGTVARRRLARAEKRHTKARRRVLRAQVKAGMLTAAEAEEFDAAVENDTDETEEVTA